VQSFEFHRLFQHGQGVLIHIFVVVMLILFKLQQWKFWQYILSKSSINERAQPTARMIRHHQLHELIAHSLG